MEEWEMSDLKKTFQDMDKTEVGEYRYGRGHFPTEDDGGRANVEVLQALCPNPGATALESVVWAADQIEALEIFRRDAKVENAELHSQIESLQREKAELQSIADAAGMDAERAITRADKAELDLKCLQESTVDAKAYQALQRENEELSGQLKGLHLYYEGHEAQMEELRAAAITPEMRAVLKRAFALAREVEESELAEDLCGLLGEQE